MMVFIKPIPLGQASLERDEMLADRKACRHFGPCGVGEKALYLNSFYLERRYYVPLDSVQRVFKRVAMSKGGFSRHGIFASIPYLVVQYDNGKEKQCQFKYEEQVDQLLVHVAHLRPEIPRMSREAEARLEQKVRERAARVMPELPEGAQESLKALRKAEKYLEDRPDLTNALSRTAKEQRSYMRSKPAYRWVALAVMLMGLVSLVYGIYTFLTGGDLSLYFLLFGLAALFLFSSANVLPTARNNKKAIFGRAESAKREMEKYLSGYKRFPVPARYAHPVVIRRMERVIESGRAEGMEEALEVVKADLKALNATIQVEQEEYDEVVQIKPLFLLCGYQ